MAAPMKCCQRHFHLAHVNLIRSRVFYPVGFPIDKLRQPTEQPRGKRPHLIKSLAEKLVEKRTAIEIPEERRIDIGLPQTVKNRLNVRKASQERTQHKKADAELERAARLRTLSIPLDEVDKDSRLSLIGQDQIRQYAEHCGIYRSLFGQYAFFYNVVPLDVSYDYSEDEVTPVYYGNVIPPSEACTEPHVRYDASPDSLWTLVLCNPDGHLLEDDKEYLHWMVMNIPGSDVSRCDVVYDYLQPFPPRGTGFHRMVFLLYRQEKRIDLDQDKPNKLTCHSLDERTFCTRDFYARHEHVLTPSSVCWFHTQWDATLTDFFHDTLKMREPVFEYIHRPHYVKRPQFYPHRQAFNRYLDMYRDPKEIKKEIVMKRLKAISPFKADPERPKYPGIFKVDQSYPSWYRVKLKQERERFGIYKGLDDPFALDEDWTQTMQDPPELVKPWEEEAKYTVPTIWEPPSVRRGTSRRRARQMKHIEGTIVGENREKSSEENQP